MTQNPNQPSGSEHAPGNGNGKPQLDPRFIMTLEGKDFVLYQGLLDLGHQKGISRIEVEPLQIPCPENGNFAVCRSTVTSKEGEIFTDVGDASPDNCNSRVARHVLRMAATRSTARALRSFTNVGLCCLEELGDGDIHSDGKTAPAKKDRKPAASKTADEPQATATASPQPSGNNGNGGQQSRNGNGNGHTPPMSQAQRRALAHLARRQGMSEEDLNSMCNDRFGLNFEALNIRDASSLISSLQQAA